MATSVPTGIVIPLDNVNGRNARRLLTTGKKGRIISASYLWCSRNLTDGWIGHQAAGSPWGSCPSCATCLSHLSSTLLLRSRRRPLREVVRYIQDWQGGDTKLAWTPMDINGQDCNTGGNRRRVSWLTEDVVWIAAKLTRSSRRAKPSTVLSTPLASLMSHINISFCISNVLWERYQI